MMKGRQDGVQNWMQQGTRFANQHKGSKREFGNERKKQRNEDIEEGRQTQRRKYNYKERKEARKEEIKEGPTGGGQE